MAKKIIILKKQTIIVLIIIIAISIFAYVKIDSLSSQLSNVSNNNEELIEKEKVLNYKLEEIENEKQEKIIEEKKLQEAEQKRILLEQRERQIELEKKQIIATSLSKYMLDNIKNSSDIRIDLSRRLLFLNNAIMPLDNIYAFYSFKDSQPKFGYDYVEFRCLDDSHCIKYSGTGAIAYSYPVSSKYVAEKIAQDLSKL